VNLDTAEALGVGRLFWLTHEAVVAADLDSERIVLWNPSAERIFGYTAAEALGMPLDVLVPDALREAHHAGIRRFRDTGEARLVGGPPVEVPAVAKDGSVRTVALSLTSTGNEGPKRHVVAVVRDVTEQKAAEEELRRTNQAMESFVATASHDLRSPLAVILGFAQTLQRREREFSVEEQDTFLAAIVRAGKHAARLVDDLLTLSKIQAGVVAIRRQPVALADAARECAHQAAPDAEIDVDDALAVTIDRDHLCRMLLNLLDNAAKYGLPPIRVSTHVSAGAVDLSVSDGGVAVTDEFRTRMFEPFERAEPNNDVPGTGLGLSIVRGLAQANGGDVDYARVDGERNCFTLHLPRDRP